jgi:hypothetical protein
MAFSNYEELKAAVAKRRSEILTLEVDLGTDYSPEYEAAKNELAQAKVMSQVAGGFLGGNDQAVTELEQRVADLKPDADPVWIQYKKLDLGEWAVLMKQAGGQPIDQYEKVLSKTFIGVYGQDPVKPDDAGDDWEAPAPLSTEAKLLSSKGNEGILPGGSLHSVVQNFIAWQNSGGDVTIRPTKSGLV